MDKDLFEQVAFEKECIDKLLNSFDRTRKFMDSDKINDMYEKAVLMKNEMKNLVRTNLIDEMTNKHES